MTTKDKLIEKLKEYIEFQDYFVFGLSRMQKIEQGALLTEIASLESELANEHQIAEEEKTDSDKKWKNPDCALDLLAFNCGRECSCANCPEYRGEY